LFSNEARLRCIKLTSQSRGIRRISLSRGGIAYSFRSSGDPGASRWSGGTMRCARGWTGCARFSRSGRRWA